MDNAQSLGGNGRSTTRRASSFSLIVGHMGGMIDIAALPVWVGTLIAGYGLGPAQAGGLATLFLGGAVTSSILLAPFFHRLPSRWMPPCGFAVSAASFLAMTQMTGIRELAAAHLVAGLANGLALSFVHGTMAKTANPHHIFALGGMALGIFAVVFLTAAPMLIAWFGPSVLFGILGLVMALSALATGIVFPSQDVADSNHANARSGFDASVWFCVAGIMGMALVHAMIFSFGERLGLERGLSPEAVRNTLAASGFIAIFPPLLASLFQRWLSAIAVAVFGAVLQATVAFVITYSLHVETYVIGLIIFPFMMLFTHTFVFGYLARIEPTGRANAATPAMVMTGSAAAPLLGGVLVQTNGYPALGFAAITVAAVAAVAFICSYRIASGKSAQPGDHSLSQSEIP